MDSREWINLQEALAWALWPVVQILLGVLLASSVMTGIYMMLARAVRWMTRPKI